MKWFRLKLASEYGYESGYINLVIRYDRLNKDLIIM